MVHYVLLNVAIVLSAAEPGGGAASLPPAAASQPSATAPAVRQVEPESKPWRVALDEPVSSDRPDFTESAAVVPRGHAQLESGYTFSYDRRQGRQTREQTFPEALLRAGVVRNGELRIGWDGFSLVDERYRAPDGAGRTRAYHEHEDAGTDMSVGFKWHVLDQARAVPEFSMIGAIALPTGAESKTSGDVDPEIKLIWSYELTRRLDLTGNLNFSAPSDEIGRFFQASASVSAGYSICDWWGTYLEYFGAYPGERNGDGAHYLSAGFTFQISRNLQFDIRAGAGLNAEADDFFTGIGFVYRF